MIDTIFWMDDTTKQPTDMEKSATIDGKNDAPIADEMKLWSYTRDSLRTTIFDDFKRDSYVTAVWRHIV